MLLITMTATSMLFAKIPQGHTSASAKPDIQETDEPVMVKRGIANQLKLSFHNLEGETFMYTHYVILWSSSYQRERLWRTNLENLY